MSRPPDRHTRAAFRHEKAAKNHERAATFWDGHDKPEHAGLQRQLADYERQGAELERQWAGLIAPNPAEQAAERIETTRSDTHRHAEHLSWELSRTATALEHTAAIAEEHARRRERAGLCDAAGEEWRVADRARAYAEHARFQAERWRKLASQAPE